MLRVEINHVYFIRLEADYTSIFQPYIPNKNADFQFYFSSHTLTSAFNQNVRIIVQQEIRLKVNS